MQQVIYIAIPAVIAAPFGAYLTGEIAEYILMVIFACFLLINIGLVRLRQRMVVQEQYSKKSFKVHFLGLRRVALLVFQRDY